MAKLQKTALALLTLLAACSKQELSTFTGISMTIPYQVKVGDPISWWKKRKVKQIILEEFEKIHVTFNHWNPRSALSLYHEGKLGTLPEEALELLTLVQQIHNLSEGRFDPAQGALIQLWKTHMRRGSEPSSEELLEAESRTYFDFDGIVKGYTVDRITEALKKEGFASLYVEWGGEIRCTGQHPANRPWKIASGNQILEIIDSALATSGDGMQRWGDKTHIFDPKKKSLLTCQKTIHNITVQAESCALADAIATAAMLYSEPTELQTFIERVESHFPHVVFY